MRRRCALARIDTSTSSARDFAPVAVEARAHVQVQRFFGTKHNDKFLIFNLCQVPPLCAAERLVSHPRVASAHAPRQVHPLATRLCVLREHTRRGGPAGRSGTTTSSSSTAASSAYRSRPLPPRAPSGVTVALSPPRVGTGLGPFSRVPTPARDSRDSRRDSAIIRTRHA